MHCLDCRTPLDDAAIRCPKCGASAAPVEPSPDDEPLALDGPRPKPRGRLLGEEDPEGAQERPPPPPLALHAQRAELQRAQARSARQRKLAVLGAAALGAIAWAAATGRAERWLGLDRPKRPAVLSRLSAALATCSAPEGWRGRARLTIERSGDVSNAQGGGGTPECVAEVLRGTAVRGFAGRGFVYADLPLLSAEGRVAVEDGGARLLMVRPSWRVSAADGDLDTDPLSERMEGAAAALAGCCQTHGFVTAGFQQELELTVVYYVEPGGRVSLRHVGSPFRQESTGSWMTSDEFLACARGVIEDRLAVPGHAGPQVQVRTLISFLGEELER